MKRRRLRSIGIDKAVVRFPRRILGGLIGKLNFENAVSAINVLWFGHGTSGWEPVAGVWAKTFHGNIPRIVSPQRIEPRDIRIFIIFLSEAIAFLRREFG
jgi:hypothetical protein